MTTTTMWEYPQNKQISQNADRTKLAFFWASFYDLQNKDSFCWPYSGNTNMLSGIGTVFPNYAPNIAGKCLNHNQKNKIGVCIIASNNDNRASDFRNKVSDV